MVLQEKWGKRAWSRGAIFLYILYPLPGSPPVSIFYHPSRPYPSPPAEKPPSIDLVGVTVLCTYFIVTLYQPPTNNVAAFTIPVMHIIVSTGVEVQECTVLSRYLLSLSMILRTRVLQPWHY